MDRLDEATIKSFHLVTHPERFEEECNSKVESNDGIEGEEADLDTATKRIGRYIKEGNEHVRLILRSGGCDPFTSTASSNTQSRKPPLIVALAHHVTTDTFLLFALSPHTVPCRLARFDRDGEAMEKKSEDFKSAFSWSDVDITALVTAVERVERDSSGYFWKRSDAAGDINYDPTTHELAECLRLVPRGIESTNDNKQNNDNSDAEDERKSIRSIIVNEIFSSENDGIKLHHPDPNFMMPLAKSLSSELEKWRTLCIKLPSFEFWPELNPPSTIGEHDIESGKLFAICIKLPSFKRWPELN